MPSRSVSPCRCGRLPEEGAHLPITEPKITARQRCIVWIWIALATLMGIFPPWTQRGGLSVGYAWIVAPLPYATHIDTSRLLLQWALLTFLCGGLCLAWPFGQRARTHPRQQWLDLVDIFSVEIERSEPILELESERLNIEPPDRLLIRLRKVDPATALELVLRTNPNLKPGDLFPDSGIPPLELAKAIMVAMSRARS